MGPLTAPRPVISALIAAVSLTGCGLSSDAVSRAVGHAVANARHITGELTSPSTPSSTSPPSRAGAHPSKTPQVGVAHRPETASGPSSDPTPTTSPSTNPGPVPTGPPPPPVRPPVRPPPPPPPPSGAWPNAANTGYHVALSAPEPAFTITVPGTVINGRHLVGSVLVQADNVTIKNSLIDSQGGWGVLLGTSTQCNINLVVQDTEINGGGRSDPGSNPTTAGMNQYNYCKPDSQVAAFDPMAWTCLRCDIHDNEDGVKLSSRTLLQDSYIHDLYHPTSTHHSDGFQLSDGAWATVRHNFIDVGAVNEPFTDGSMFIDAEVRWGGVHDITLDGNLLKGGLYPIWIYDEQRSGPTQISNITVINNRVYRQSFSGNDIVVNYDGYYTHPFVQSGNGWFDAGAHGPAGEPVTDCTNSGQG